MIICYLRYFIDRDNIGAFKHYAQVWMRLIEKYGGTHLGYFLPTDPPPSAAFSFPGVGVEGPDDIAVAIFSFPTLEAYETYRREVKEDPECQAATRHHEQTECFTKYERTFLKMIERSP